MKKWLWGIIILAIISALVTLFTHWGAKKHSAEMGDSIRSALSEGGQYGFANVDMSGNVATLSGIAPSKALADQAAKTAQATECKTCKKKGKIWHVVENKLAVAKPVATAKPAAIEVVSPYRFSTIKNADGTVDISGYVENQEERASIMAAATALFGDNLRAKKLRIAPGAPNGDWSEVIGLHLPKLASLDSGSFSLDDQQALLTGKVGAASVRDDINAIVSQLPKGYVGAVNITVPNADAVNAGEVQSAALCQSLFDGLKGNTRINFASGNTQIRGAQSYDLLNALASAAKQCKSFQMVVEGHTDSSGTDEANQYLSEQRAISVVNYLAQNDVENSRMTAKGLGETQPIASNETPEGRAANRRINFIVTQSE